MNAAGLFIAFFGAVLLGVAQWQMNPLVALWSVNFVRVEGQDEDFKRVVRSARAKTIVGWGLISLGFLLQFIAAL